MYPNYPNQQQMPYPGQAPQYPPMQNMPGYPPMPDYQNQQQMPGYPMQPQMPGYQMQAPMPGYQMQAPMPGQYGDFQQQQQHIPQQYAPQFSHGAPSMAQPQPRPTVIRSPNFDASNDAAILRKAMKGFGTDEAAIINVLCRRPCDQRMEIVRAYKTAYGKDLIENIKKETSGNFEKLLVALLTPRIQYYCEEIKGAMDGAGTDEDVLIEILCGGLPNREVQAITTEFQRLYGHSLEEALKEETSWSFKRLLVSLSTGNRDESMITNIDSARTDAQSLVHAGVKCFGTDESEFNRILCLRNFAQLRLVADEYQKIRGHSLEDDIKKEFSGDVEQGMVSVLRCAINRSLFFAKCLHKSVAGFGTNDRDLIRLCVTRSDIDMMDIKEEYQRKYNESLRDAIKGDTSGHYKHALYVLIGENKS